MKFCARVLLVVFASLLTISCFTTNSETTTDNTTQDVTNSNALWLAESEGLLKIATTDGHVLLDVDRLGSVPVVAVDDHRGSVWAYGTGALHVLDFQGVEKSLLTDDALSLLPGNSGISRLVLDDSDGSVWVASEKELRHIDSQGNITATVSLSENIENLAVDTTNSDLWIAGTHSLYRYDVSSSQLLVIDGFTITNVIRAIAYDSTLEQLWVASDEGLSRIDANGTVQINVPITSISHIAFDEKDRIWAATDTELYHIDSSGLVMFSLTPFVGEREGNIVDLVVDNSDGSAWVANSLFVSHFSGMGARLHDIGMSSLSGNKFIHGLAHYADNTPPELAFSAPLPNSYVNSATPTIELVYSDAGSGVDLASMGFTLDGVALALNCNALAESASCMPLTPVADGAHAITVSMSDLSGNESASVPLTFSVDAVPPVLTLSIAEPVSYANNAAFTLTGSVSEIANVTVNQQAVTLDPGNGFIYSSTLVEGSNPVEVIATDPAANSHSITIDVVLDTIAPEGVDVASIVFGDLLNGQVPLSGGVGSTEPGALVTLTNIRTGESVVTQAAADGSFAAIIAAQHGDVITVVVSDAVSNASSESLVTVGGGVLPPAPESIAPPLDATIATNMADSVSFLYSGSEPIQTGVDPQAIEAKRVAVVRARVFERSGAALSGVTITVKDHTEYGETLSRADGAYDMVINGGELLVIDYVKEGYLPVQRRVDAPWGDFFHLDDVVMIPLDAQVTT